MVTVKLVWVGPLSFLGAVHDTPDTTYYIKDFFDHKDKETKPIAVTQYDCIMHFIMLYMCTNRRNFYKIQKSRKR